MRQRYIPATTLFLLVASACSAESGPAPEAGATSSGAPSGGCDLVQSGCAAAGGASGSGGAPAPNDPRAGTAASAGSKSGAPNAPLGGAESAPASEPPAATGGETPSPGGGAGGASEAAPALGAGGAAVGDLDPQAPSSAGAACDPTSATGHFQMENLDRGLVAVRSGNSNYLGWRMLGYEYDSVNPERIAYHVYRDGDLLQTVTTSTNYVDEGGAVSAAYAVSVVIDGEECPRSPDVTVWTQNYLNIPLEPPAPGTSPNGETYSYTAGTVTRSTGAVNDGSPGDLDGDGTYELVVIWQPSNEQDNSKAGHTGPVYVDSYRLTGERLWRMNLGPNVRAGAHYTQFLVYDLDGDGRAEVAFKTAPGVRDGLGNFLSRGPAENDDDSLDYRNDDGYVLSGPEYLTVFDGLTGAELDTVNFDIGRGAVAAWGDSYGNRVDRFLASVGFVSDEGGSGKGSGRPALLMARGYYTRATVSAWTWRDGALAKIWTADSDNDGSAALAGQGAHSMAVADVDGDGAQEVLYGAAMIQSDGSFGCSTGLGHGDALHVADLLPSRPGLEVFMPHEDKAKPWWDVREAESCAIIHASDSTGADNGRGVAADILASNPGAEFWSSSDSALRSATTNDTLGGAKPSQVNFLIWWDGDALREVEDGTAISKGDGTRLFTCEECMSNNYTKATPTLTADLFGDWREEIVWRTPDSSALRIYTTTAVTDVRLFTLMHDPQYRMQVSSEQTAYNQPPHPSFFLGDGMTAPAAPDIYVK